MRYKDVSFLIWNLQCVLLAVCSSYQLEPYLEQKLETFDQELQEASTEVVDLFSVHYEMPELAGDFHHSYVSGTGFLNREETIVDGLVAVDEVQLLDNIPATDWEVFEYNTREFIIAASGRGLTFIDLAGDETYVATRVLEGSLSLEHFVVHYSAEQVGTLYLAVLQQLNAGRFINIYSLDEDFQLELVSSTTVNDDVVSIRHQHIPLINKHALFAVGASTSSKVYSKVYTLLTRERSMYLREMTDLSCAGSCVFKPFLVHGEVLVAVASDQHDSILYRFDNENYDFEPIQQFAAASHVEVFRIGFHHFVAWVSEETLAIYTYNGADFTLWQVITSPGLMDLQVLALPTCRDEVLLVTTSNPPAGDEQPAIGILKYWSGSHNFTYTAAECIEYEEHQDVSVNSPLDHDYHFDTFQHAQIACAHNSSCRGVQAAYDSAEDEEPHLVYELQSATWNQAGQAFKGLDFWEKIKLGDLYCLDQLVSPLPVQPLPLRHLTGLMFQSPDTGIVTIMSVAFHLQHEHNPVWLENRDLLARMAAIEDQIILQNDVIDEISAVLSAAVLPRGDVTITASQRLEGVMTPEVTVDSLAMLGDLVFDKSDLQVEDFSVPLNAFHDRVALLEETLQDFNLILNDLVYIDEAAQISGSKIFTTQAEIGQLKASSLAIGEILDIDVSDLLYDLVNIDLSTEVEGIKTLSSPVNVRGNVISDDVNGLDVSEDVVSVGREQIVEGSVEYIVEPLIKSDVQVAGVTGFIDLSEEAIGLEDATQITDTKWFDLDVLARSATVGGFLDDVDVTDMAASIVTRSGDQQILGVTEYGEDLIIKSDLYINGLLNTIDIAGVVRHAVRVDRPAEISAAKIFNLDLDIEANLNVLETVNGVRIPDDFFMTDADQYITGYKQFSGYGVFIDRLAVEGLVDGLILPTDVVTLSTDEVLYDLVFLEGIIVHQDVQCNGHIDGLDVSDLASKSIRIDNDVSAYMGLQFVGEVVVERNLDVRTTVNNMDIELLASDIVFKDDVTAELASFKQFRGLAVGDLVASGNVNGMNIQRDFVDLRSPQDISGVKRFAEVITVNHDLEVIGLIDEVDVTSLYNERVTLSTPQDIAGNCGFTELGVVEGNLGIGDRLAGIKPSQDLVFKHGNQTILGNKKFDNILDVNNLATSNVVVSNMIDSMDIGAFANERGDLNQEQSIAAMLELMDDVVLNGDLNVDLVNGVDLRAFLHDLVLTNVQQNIVDNKVFLSRIQMRGPVTTDGINNLFVDEVNEWAFPVRAPVVAMGTLTFMDELAITRGTVGGSIDDVNIQILAEELVHRNGGNQITGYKVLSDGFTVLGSLLSNSISGHDLSTDLLTRTTDQVIAAEYRFPSVRVGGNMEAGLVNGFDLADLQNKVMRTDRVNTLHGLLLVEEDTKANEVIANGGVNGVDVVQLADLAVYLDLDQEIIGRKHLMVGEVTDDIIVGDAVNGQVLYDWAEEVIYVDLQWQEVIGEKVMIHLESHDVVSRCPVSATTVSEVDMIALVEEAIALTGGELSGSVTFTFDHAVWTDLATADGVTVNGVDLSVEAVTLEGNQQISGFLGLEIVRSFGDVQVVESINDQYLPSLLPDTLTLAGHVHVSGYKVFSNRLIFIEDFILDGLIKDIDFDEEVLPLHSPQFVVMKSFTSVVTVEGDLNIMGDINSVILSQLAASALYSNVEYQQVSAAYKLLGDVTFMQDVDTDGTLDTVDLSELESPTLGDIDQQQLYEWQESSMEQCSWMNTMFGTLRGGLYQLDHWEVMQELDEEAAIHSIAITTGSQRVLMTSVLVDDECGLVNLYSIAAEDGFHITGEVKTNVVIGFSTYMTGGNTFVVTASLSNCGDMDGSIVWLYDINQGLVIYSPLQYPAVKTSAVAPGGVAHLLLVGGLDEPTILLLEEPSAEFNMIFNLNPGVLDAVIFECSNTIYLATCHIDGTSEIYRVKQARVVSVQRLVTPLCSSVAVLKVDARLYLTVSRTESLSVVWDRPLVFAEVYLWTPDPVQPFVPFHATTVHDAPLPVTLTGLTAVKDNFYLATVDQVGVNILQYKGASGFAAVGSIYDESIGDVHPFNSGEDYYLAMTRVDASTVVYKAAFIDSHLDSDGLDCGFVNDATSRILSLYLDSVRTQAIEPPMAMKYYPVAPYPVQSQHYNPLYDTDGYVQDAPINYDTLNHHDTRIVPTERPRSPYSHVSGFLAHRSPPQRGVLRKYIRRHPPHYRGTEDSDNKIIRTKKESKSIRAKKTAAEFEKECNLTLNTKLQEGEISQSDAFNDLNKIERKLVLKKLPFNVLSLFKNFINTLNASSQDLNILKAEVAEIGKEISADVKANSLSYATPDQSTTEGYELHSTEKSSKKSEVDNLNSQMDKESITARYASAITSNSLSSVLHSIVEDFQQLRLKNVLNESAQTMANTSVPESRKPKVKASEPLISSEVSRPEIGLYDTEVSTQKSEWSLADQKFVHETGAELLGKPAAEESELEENIHGHSATNEAGKVNHSFLHGAVHKDGDKQEAKKDNPQTVELLIHQPKDRIQNHNEYRSSTEQSTLVDHDTGILPTKLSHDLHKLSAHASKHQPQTLPARLTVELSEDKNDNSVRLHKSIDLFDQKAATLHIEPGQEGEDTLEWELIDLNEQREDQIHGRRATKGTENEPRHYSDKLHQTEHSTERAHHLFNTRIILPQSEAASDKEVLESYKVKFDKSAEELAVVEMLAERPDDSVSVHSTHPVESSEQQLDLSTVNHHHAVLGSEPRIADSPEGQNPTGESLQGNTHVNQLRYETMESSEVNSDLNMRHDLESSSLEFVQLHQPVEEGSRHKVYNSARTDASEQKVDGTEVQKLKSGARQLLLGSTAAKQRISDFINLILHQQPTAERVEQNLPLGQHPTEPDSHPEVLQQAAMAGSKISTEIPEFINKHESEIIYPNFHYDKEDHLDDLKLHHRTAAHGLQQISYKSSLKEEALRSSINDSATKSEYKLDLFELHHTIESEFKDKSVQPGNHAENDRYSTKRHPVQSSVENKDLEKLHDQISETPLLRLNHSQLVDTVGETSELKHSSGLNKHSAKSSTNQLHPLPVIHETHDLFKNTEPKQSTKRPEHREHNLGDAIGLHAHPATIRSMKEQDVAGQHKDAGDSLMRVLKLVDSSHSLEKGSKHSQHLQDATRSSEIIEHEENIVGFVGINDPLTSKTAGQKMEVSTKVHNYTSVPKFHGLPTFPNVAAAREHTLDEKFEKLPNSAEEKSELHNLTFNNMEPKLEDLSELFQKAVFNPSLIYVNSKEEELETGLTSESKHDLTFKTSLGDSSNIHEKSAVLSYESYVDNLAEKNHQAELDKFETLSELSEDSSVDILEDYPGLNKQPAEENITTQKPDAKNKSEMSRVDLYAFLRGILAIRNDSTQVAEHKVADVSSIQNKFNNSDFDQSIGNATNIQNLQNIADFSATEDEVSSRDTR